MESKKVTVFCAASDSVSKKYLRIAREVGKLLAKNKMTLVYGGDKVGLMGSVSEEMKIQNRHVIGVCVESMYRQGKFYEACDEIILTNDLCDRKQRMIQLSETIIVLPGGIGTINEFLEVMVLIHLRLQNKKVLVLNYNHFFDELFVLIDHLIEQNFASKQIKDSYIVVKNIAQLESYL